MLNVLTPEERKNPLLLKSSSAKRIDVAKRAGVSVADVNRMLKHFDHVKDLISKMPKDFSPEKLQDMDPKKLANDPAMKEFLKMLHPKEKKILRRR